ncbi:hypothetical protein VNI00_005487 [Paramarasmius palmivorus]|uniref:Cytochrome P450 n=1 Tax=Paramarasmius palmivorus TaxID=297713 RepID=A0AAW0DBQ5_9AGAR
MSDPAAYTDIYNSPYKMLKDPGLYRDAFQFGIPPNSGTVCDPKIHSALKSLIASYFSRKNILKLEDIIQERVSARFPAVYLLELMEGQVDRLISQLVQNHRSTPANMTLAFRSVALDVISLYTLRTSTDTTSFPAFSHPRVIGTEETVSVIWMTKHLTFLKHLALRLPSWLAVYISPAAKPHLEIQAEMENAIDEATAYSESKLAGGHHDQDDDDDVDRLNIFYAILRNSRVEGKLKYPGLVTKDQMISEAFGLRIAGSDTIANACMIGTRYLIQEDGVREKLAKELETAWPDRRSRIPLERLEKLPYLTAVIKESLRFSSGIVTPMTRVAPESGAVIAGHPVPPGTVVSIGNTFVHMNLSIFPEPKRFYPERWLDEKNHNLDQYLVAFGKGPRSCLGIK